MSSPSKPTNHEPAENSTKNESFTNFVVESKFFNDLRTSSMKAQYGPASLGLYFEIINALYQRTSHRLPITLFKGLAKSYGFDEVQAKDFLAFLCKPDIGYLKCVGSDEVACPGVDERVAKRLKAREAWRGKKSGTQKGNTETKVEPSVVQTSTPLSPENIEGKTKECSGFPPNPLTPTPTPHPTDLKKETVGLEPPPPDPDESPYIAKARAWFEPNAEQHPGTGRRPLKKWPLIRTTPHSLARVMENFDRDGIPNQYRKDAFDKVQARLALWVEQGKSIQNVDPTLWLDGFAKQEVLETITKARRAKSSELYLEKAAS